MIFGDGRKRFILQSTHIYISILSSSFFLNRTLSSTATRLISDKAWDQTFQSTKHFGGLSNIKATSQTISTIPFLSPTSITLGNSNLQTFFLNRLPPHGLASSPVLYFSFPVPFPCLRGAQALRGGPVPNPSWDYWVSSGAYQNKIDNE